LGLVQLLFRHKTIIDRALEEDIGAGDITSDSIIPKDAVMHAQLIAKADGVTAGLFLLKKICSEARVHLHVEDGAAVRKNQVLADIEGNARYILARERVVLNFVRHLSGIATLTRRYVMAATNGVKILDTRKTTPGLRKLEKYAVRMGGGQNHRMGLYDMVLIKDNHIAVAGITDAVQRARHTGKIIEVEVESLVQLKEVINAKPDLIMLDNMPIAYLKKAVKTVGGRIPIEISGGVTLEIIPQLCKLGVQYISVGALTHSAPSLDVSIEVRGAL